MKRKNKIFKFVKPKIEFHRKITGYNLNHYLFIITN